LAVLDATDLAAGPVAEIVVPQQVPYGFPRHLGRGRRQLTAGCFS
jgi:carotenoid cleavage dioxygenase-like enzyme